MTVEELLTYAKGHIHSDYSKILLGELIDKNPLELLNYLSMEIDDDKVALYKKEVEAVKNNIPIQYAIGNVNFYGNKFIINKNVLIPRFETELLIEKTINYVNKYFTKPIDIIDLGTGSGCIGLTLEKELPINRVDLVDISKDALEVTKVNINNLNSKANIIESNMFEKVNDKYDLIISNPPYIRDDEEIEEIVKNNEPHLALYGGKDGLDYYRNIINNLENHMKDKCLVAFEIGIEQGDLITELVNKVLPDTKVIVENDLTNRPRYVFIFKNLE